ncbi:MAG TPA: hypothetical protein VJR94_07140 [Candidatus Nitrosocosmicus sp.]|nr:hypothetical protein [Candidatus Nitrosocosmicus sp.]
MNLNKTKGARVLSFIFGFEPTKTKSGFKSRTSHFSTPQPGFKPANNLINLESK